MHGPRRCLCGCGVILPNGPEPGKPRKFATRAHKRAFEKQARQVGAQTLAKKEKRPRGPSKHAEEVSRRVFQEIVPLDHRAECILQACRNLGVSDERQIRDALRRNGIDPNALPPELYLTLAAGHPIEAHT